MESMGKVYFSHRDIVILKSATIVAFFAITLFLPYILQEININFVFHWRISFFLGVLFMFLLVNFGKSLKKPKIRICDHFLMLNYDQDVLNWNQITSARKEGNTLIFNIQKCKYEKGSYKVSLSSVPKREEFIREVEGICENKGIPFKRQ